VLLVGYNSEAALARYLPDFVASLPAEFEIILIDNDSADRTIDTFRRISPHGRVIEAGKNLGFAKAVNLGASQATGEWLLLLNPDAAASATDIEALEQSVAGRSACAAVGPIVDSGGKVIPAGRFPTIWRMFLHSTTLSVLAQVNELFEGHYIRVKGTRRGLRRVDWITGGCMLIRREAWIAVAGFTERWFMYAEDIEFCFRLKRRGYEVLLNQDVTVFHEIGQSSAGIDGKTSVVWLENLFDFYSSEIAASFVGRFMWKSVVCAGFAIRSVLFYFLASVRGNEKHAREATRFRIYAANIRPSRADFERRQ
jgi:GT2 family glycosyltransferase